MTSNGVAERRHVRTVLHAMAALWIASVLSRPLGASLGSYLSQAIGAGGLGFGTTATSALPVAAIAAVVVHLIRTGRGRVVVAVAF